METFLGELEQSEEPHRPEKYSDFRRILEKVEQHPNRRYFIFKSIIKTLFIIGLISLLRTIFARLRIDQMVRFCWKYMVPFALLQLVINLILKGVILQ